MGCQPMVRRGQRQLRLSAAGRRESRARPPVPWQNETDGPATRPTTSSSSLARQLSLARQPLERAVDLAPGEMLDVLLRVDHHRRVGQLAELHQHIRGFWAAYMDT